MPKKVLITGATGDAGRAGVREAIALGLDVRAMARKIDKRSEALSAQGAEVVVGDMFEIDSIRAALESVDAAYFVYPVAPGLLTATLNFAQAAKEAGTKAVLNLSQRSPRHFLPFSRSHCYDGLHERLTEPPDAPGRTKGRGAEYGEIKRPSRP